MDQPQTGKEIRKFPRIPKEVSINVTKVTYPMPEGNGEAVRGKNIARDGICFTGPSPYVPKTSLILKINLRGWQYNKKNTSSIVDPSTTTAPLTAVAEVVWSKKLSDGSGYETGLKFIDIYEDDYKALKTYMEKIEKKLSSQ